MSGPALEGIRVVEVAQWAFVPSAGALLADLGAEVVKVEHPVHGDPYRGLVTYGFSPSVASGVDGIVEQTNRNKRSVGLDLGNAHGRAVLGRLVETADVFLTSFLPDACTKLRITVDDVRAHNPSIVYARGHGQGARGPDAGRGAYDSTAFWSRAGLGRLFGPPDGSAIAEPRPAFGDRAGAMALAFGIAAALVRRARTGEPALVDVSLLGTAMWMASSDVVATGMLGHDPARRTDRYQVQNPLVGPYRSADGRWLTVNLFESDRWWRPFCEQIGRPDLADDARFADAAGRARHAAACVGALEEAFAARTLDEWRACFADRRWTWGPVQTVGEVLEDPQVAANGYLQDVETGGGTVTLVGGPAQLDGGPAPLRRAPEAGEHTEEVLLEVGLTWDDIAAAKEAGAIT